MRDFVKTITTSLSVYRAIMQYMSNSYANGKLSIVVGLGFNKRPQFFISNLVQDPLMDQVVVRRSRFWF